MFDIGTKFKYFHNILGEVYKIIDFNWEMKDEQLPKLLDILRAHLNIYNEKNRSLKMGIAYDEEHGIMEVFLSDYVSGRGRKKLFQDKIGIKTLIRDRLLDELLDGIENYEYE